MSQILEINKCASCVNLELKEIYDFGLVPLAGYFPLAGTESEKFRIKMRLLYCSKCTLVQISPDVSDKLLFHDYRYISSVGMQNHFNDFANWFNSEFQYSTSIKILEIGCNDGPLLASLTKIGYEPIGIDPAKNIVNLAKNKGLKVINDFFNEEAAKKYDLFEKFDVIISCNSFAHVSNVLSFAHTVSKSLKSNGILIIEVQSLFDMISSNSFDFVYHEHKYYYSLSSISNLLTQCGLNLIDAIRIPTHGGSYRLVFSKSCSNKSRRLQTLEQIELSDYSFEKSLVNSIGGFMNQISLTANFLKKCRLEEKKVVAFGASGRANMLLSYLGEDASKIEVIFDESSERIGRNMGFSRIPIEAFNKISDYEYDYLIILAWNYAESLVLRMPNKGKILCPLPKFEIM
jgi:SAM-dependent methyltransferase